MSGETRYATEAARCVAGVADELAPYHRRYEAERDSRAVFAYAYHDLTRDLAGWLGDTDADFDDPDWVADLAVAFGARYTAAMDGIDEWRHANDGAGGSVESLYGTVPRPWADVYRAICVRRSTVLEDLVFAMGAHITYDLPYALLEVDTATDRLGDFHRMNGVMASRTDAIQAAVTDRYNRVLGRLDRVAGGADERLTNYWIRLGRSMAWYNAMRLQSSLSRPEAEGSIERSTYHLIESVRSDSPWPVKSKLDVYRTLHPLTRRWPSPTSESAD